MLTIQKSVVFRASVAIAWLWPLAVHADCGCDAMTLKHAGTTGIMCSNEDLNFLKTECAKYTGSSKGCSTTYAYDCNLGVNSQKYGNVKPYQKTGFESVATLSSGSTVSDCKTGQILQETIKSGGNLEPNPNINPTSVNGTVVIGGNTVDVDNSGANPFPQIGATDLSGNPKYGGDNYADYTAHDVLFSYAPPVLSWWDNTDQSKDSQSEAATWHYKFISFVNGSGSSKPSCACAFDITVDWKSNNNNPATTYTYDAGHSHNCTW
jgi:hypothetical protein